MRKPRRRRAGFTLLELMVAMSITLGLGLGLVMLYNRCMDSFSKVEKSLRALQAFRTGADRLELELNSCVVKAQVWSRMNWRAPGTIRANWNYMVNAVHGYTYVGSKPLDFCTHWSCNPPYGGGGCTQTVSPHNALPEIPCHTRRGLFGINFRKHYVGFYSSTDGWRIDRVQYWFNPGEGQIEWNDGIDNDGDDNPDDALNPFHVRADDRGCLVYRKVPDEKINLATWDGAVTYEPAMRSLDRPDPLPDQPYNYLEAYEGPFNLRNAAGASWPPTGDLSPPRNRDLTDRDDVTAGMTEAEINATIPPLDEVVPGNPLYDDDAIVIGEGFSNVRFYYIYKTNDSPVLKRADWWPWDHDAGGTPNNDPFDNNFDQDPTTGVWNVPMPRWTVRGSSDIWNQGSPDPPDPSLSDTVDATYLSLPLAVEIVFTSNVAGMENQSFTKLVYLYNSQWLRMLNPDNLYQ